MSICRRGSFFLVSVSLVIFLLATLAFASEDAKGLWRAKCGSCHTPNIVKMHKNFSKEQWVEVIDRMRGTGLEISAEDEQAIAQYLADTIKK